ncbi:FAD-dependent oxidoreductase [Bacillus xiapuensis]|uniref:FAD-dependent oxidoreductase n=1 Tax=Bacillus xiapuensis TaxID=2014075 RepID=UPI000C2318E3|nr:FAD-dependent monooxygenase [Bacillus xiapuensis]
MIPIRHNAEFYVSGNCVLLGDAAHSVHPMAGEGMNLAIQDAESLGDLLSWIYEQGHWEPEHLKWYEQVRKPRAEHLSKLSHQLATAYSYWQLPFGKARAHILKRIEQIQRLHFKQMLNISGLGMWKDTLTDRLVQTGALSGRFLPEVTRQDSYFFDDEEERPWRYMRGGD